MQLLSQLERENYYVGKTIDYLERGLKYRIKDFFFEEDFIKLLKLRIRVIFNGK